MYLLIPSESPLNLLPPSQFTFHNVSINSLYDSSSSFAKMSFTFHNVSINSIAEVRKAIQRENLHSIMYLLIQRIVHQVFLRIMTFTFHNVSINSIWERLYWSWRLSFTFHNVSINSKRYYKEKCDKIHLHSIMYLLILVKDLSRFGRDYHLHSIMYLLIPMQGNI